MELNKIYTRTTWNDAAEAINTNNLKINQAIEELRHQSGGAGDISVTTDKIVNGAVTTQKIAHQAVTSDKIAPNTITEEHLSKELTDGTYPNVTVGNATKAVTAESAKSAASASTATLAINLQNAPELTTNNEQIVVKVGDKTSNALTVPYAQRADFATDLSGRVEATPEVFTYRPSAGDKSIKDDNAFIRMVKGNSVVFNQLSKDEWVLQQAAGTVNNREYTLTSMTGSFPGIWCNKGILTPIGHKVLVSVYTRQEGVSAQQLRVNFQGTNVSLQYNESVPDGLVYRGVIFEVAHTNTTNCTLFCMTNIPTLIQYKDPQIFDLTQMFGAGNEPTTVEEFRALYPNSYYPYNAGELRNLVCSGIKTVGFNEFNGTYARVLPNESYYLGGSYTSIGFAKELGEATETISIPSNRIYTPTQLGYIYASGTDICINLHHTGYRDGEYAPYKEVNHSLPLSKITNGEPLRKAGSVYDEINETEYIRRVGVRGYATGDKDDAALLTDGRYTNYPLDEPIVKPIETPIDLNYYVEDFGTEEAILAENSAPFSADIIYQFNATDQVRNNTRNIQRLKKTAFTPSGSTSQYIRGDGSYADVSELASVIPIYDGEGAGIDNEDGGQNLEFSLFPQYYAKSVYTADADMYKEVIIRVEVPDNTDFVAEYWFELEIGESIPQIRFENQDNVGTSFRFNGEIRTDAVNIWHLITTDGGTRFFGEIKNYVV